MDLDTFKDKLFELLNEADGLAIEDLELDDTANMIRLRLADGASFKIQCEEYKK